MRFVLDLAAMAGSILVLSVLFSVVTSSEVIGELVELKLPTDYDKSKLVLRKFKTASGQNVVNPALVALGIMIHNVTWLGSTNTNDNKGKAIAIDIDYNLSWIDGALFNKREVDYGPCKMARASKNASSSRLQNVTRPPNAPIGRLSEETLDTLWVPDLQVDNLISETLLGSKELIVEIVQIKYNSRREWRVNCEDTKDQRRGDASNHCEIKIRSREYDSDQLELVWLGGESNELVRVANNSSHEIDIENVARTQIAVDDGDGENGKHFDVLKFTIIA